MINYEKILKELTLEEKIGQLFCLSVTEKNEKSEYLPALGKIRPGGLFVANTTAEKIKEWTDMANENSKIPVIVASDVEHGADIAVNGTGLLPLPMAWGACGDKELIRLGGEQTAKICRKNGVQWTFGPVVDINLNPNCSESNIRSVSDDPKIVSDIAGAYMEGLMENGLMVASCKHFPGQGVDDRNSHFCTTINTLSKRKWLATYGKVYKEMIKKGAPSVMIGHMALPCFEKEKDELGYLPAVLSKSLITDLLKGKLGFKGAVVSDAMSMIGVASRVSLDKVAVNFLKAGGDMILFPEKGDFERVLAAVKSGELPMSRIDDAVLRILSLKDRARLFEDQKALCDNISLDFDYSATAQKIADKSVKIVRDYNKIIPADLKKGDKILFLNMLEPFFHQPPTGKEFAALKNYFESKGFVVDQLYNPKHKEVRDIMDGYKLVLLNCKMSSRDYHGASLRVGWNNIMVLWRAYVLQHPGFIFLSFGDPYKLYDFPYLKEYVNVFSFTEESQVAAGKLILGEIKETAKNPVDFRPYFKRDK